MEIKSGYAAIIGLPNSGKSSLLNAILGQKISITTNKPQTTRKSIAGILTEEGYQIIFLDTPGILKPEYLLQERMMEYVGQSVKDADVVLFLIDLENDPQCTRLLGNEYIAELLANTKKGKILILNKADKSNDAAIKELFEKYSQDKTFNAVIPVSSMYKFNIQSIVQAILEFIPVHPKYYEDDIAANETERFFVSEIIREKIFELYKEEIPYSCEVIIDDYKERPGRKDYISAEINVERNSQKGIIIGKMGEAIKKLGSKSREAIEEFLQKEVYLELRVKVAEKWRTNELSLKSFGYNKGLDE
jgi:GTP-binding protein Era